MSCNCGSTSSTSSGCEDPAEGAAYCDERFDSLPTATALKLVGSDGECLYNFPEGSRGLVWFSGDDNLARVSEAPCADLPALINYLKDSNNSDGLARKNGSLIEGAPENFNHLMVMRTACDECDSPPCWYKWRGQEDLPGYVYWNGENFVFGQINEEGVETAAILSKVTSGYLPIYEESINPAITGTKRQGYWCPGTSDMPFVSETGVVAGVNPTSKRGFLVYELEDACSGKIVPQVKKLCEIAAPACEALPVPTQLVGCDTDGDTAALPLSPDLPENACTLSPMTVGSGADIVWMPVGQAFYPGIGTLRSALSGSGAVSNTITYAQISAAAGYNYPHVPTHYIIWCSATINAEVAGLGVRKSLTITVGGRLISSVSAMVWDAAHGDDENTSVGSVIVPASANGDISFSVTHPSTADSTYSYTVDVTGAYICPQAL